MSADKLALHMAQFLRLLADEVENNKAMAKRLAAPLAEYLAAEGKKASAASSLRSKKSTRELIPEDFDPFEIYYEKGSVGLYSALQPMDAQVLKAVLSYFALDPTRSYTRWRKQERLAEFVVQRVKAMSSRGEAFE